MPSLEENDLHIRSAIGDDTHYTFDPVSVDMVRRNDQFRHLLLYDVLDSDIRSWRAVEARLFLAFAEELEAFTQAVSFQTVTC